jgi:hypothetical protein
MTDFRLLNGRPKATIIERFDGSILLLGPDRSKRERPSIRSCIDFAKKKGWEVNIEHIRKTTSGGGIWMKKD